MKKQDYMIMKKNYLINKNINDDKDKESINKEINNNAINKLEEKEKR